MAIANAITLYEDPETGQVFTRPAAGRVELTDSDIAKPNDIPASSTVKTTAKLDTSVINNITIMDPNSPDFPLGKETRINMKFVPQDAPNMWFQAGVRIQGSIEQTKREFENSSLPNQTLEDAYLRRARLEVGAGFGEHTSFIMDIRNDRVNQFLRDEGEFTIGDAYVQIKKPFDTSLVNFRMYRAKIDVSRSETIKSAYLVAYDRPLVADAAANFISFNRRAANVQMLGDWKNKIHYQIATGDSINGSGISDLLGERLFEITDQSLFYGGKILLSPFNGWEETKKTETYMGVGKHFSVGAAYWTVPEIKGKTTFSGADFDLNHQLINIEASAHYKGLLVQSEFFKFKDVVENWAAPVLNIGDSDGWYVLSEYVIPDFYYIAPFVRYEEWDRFIGIDNTDVNSFLTGVNWYLRGNTTKIGFVYEKTTAGANIIDEGVDVNDQKLRITSQFFF